MTVSLFIFVAGFVTGGLAVLGAMAYAAKEPGEKSESDKKWSAEQIGREGLQKIKP